MSSDLRLHDLATSPNNVKVRVALGYKGLEYQRLPFEFALADYPGDRSEYVRLSGQPRLPILEHGKTVIFDSSAILRYLETAFPDTPRLFSTDFEAQGEIDTWERFGKSELGAPAGLLFGFLGGATDDASIPAKACAMLHEVTARLEEQLAATGWLVGRSMTAADVVCAAVVQLGCIPEASARDTKIRGAFHEHLHLGEDRDHVRDWVNRVMVFDPQYAGSYGPTPVAG